MSFLITWAVPTQRDDGTTLTSGEISGYQIRQTVGDNVYYYQSATNSYTVSQIGGDYGACEVSVIDTQFVSSNASPATISSTTIATPSGVSVSTAVGTAIGRGSAKATPSGVSVATAVGTAVATGGAGTSTATPSGVSTSTAVGTAIATGAAKATPAGVSVGTAVGTAVAVAGNYISDINGGQPVLCGSVGNTMIVNTGFTPTSGTIGGLAVTNIQGVTPNFTFDMPAPAEGQTHPGYGSKTAVFTNGASSPQRAVVFNPKAGQDYVTLAGTIEQTIKGIGFWFSPALAVNDQIEFPSPAVVVGANAGYPNTKAVAGTHLCKHISRGDNKVRYFLLKVGP